MRPPECVLVRLGEIALKSPQVQRRMFQILLENMRTALEGLEYRLETNPNRIFIYTKQMPEAMEKIRKVFGVTSVSPCWTCFSGLNDIRMLVSDIASDILKLGEKNSFAIRAHRVGRHKFSSKEIMEEAGAAVKRVTGASVNLTKPNYEIQIEARSRKTYIFVEKIPAVGGMPVGTAGKIVALVETPEDAAAAWLMMKRGCEAAILVNDENIELAEKIKEWDKETRIFVYEKTSAGKLALMGLASLVAEKEDAFGISSGIRCSTRLDIVEKINGISKLPVYMPIFLYSEKELDSLMKLTGIKGEISEEKTDIETEISPEKIEEMAEQMLKSVRMKE